MEASRGDLQRTFPIFWGLLLKRNCWGSWGHERRGSLPQQASRLAMSSQAGSPVAISPGMSPQECVDLGAAHGALLQTTRGDTSMITLEELMHVFKGGSARIKW